jgi:hypothetical protein
VSRRWTAGDSWSRPSRPGLPAALAATGWRARGGHRPAQGVAQGLFQLCRNPLRLLDQHLLGGVEHLIAREAVRVERRRGLGGKRIVRCPRGGVVGRGAARTPPFNEVRGHVERQPLASVRRPGLVGAGAVRGDLGVHVAEGVEPR